MLAPLIILGTGGGAYDVLDTVAAINAHSVTWDVVGFLDDSRPGGSHYLGLPILGTLADASRHKGHQFINSIGSDRSFRRRLDFIQSTRLAHECFATLIHPAASVSSYTHIGFGVHICHGCSVGGGATIGDHVSLCPGVIVGHNSIIEDGALLAPGAVVSGFVQVGRTAYIGARAAVRQHVKVREDALVGMGAVVLRDVEPGSTVVGVPARPMRVSVNEPATI